MRVELRILSPEFKYTAMVAQDALEFPAIALDHQAATGIVLS